ncbi:MAG: triose-phosphate isomerase [Bdellovibrionaceae bacterium]|nr:triose-phosphate isomerase [Pseudobdellovibrionaceae bacterium]|tara:strand:+ start:97 stop:894 length:798 start_codon:yes stop_codon:yes gene_type:complete
MNQHSRGIIVAGNWKMNQTNADTSSFLRTVNEHPLIPTLQSSPVTSLIFPSFLSLMTAQNEKGSSLEIGSQNTHWEDHGAFTGEVSTTALKEIGIHWSLTGHSERRQYFGETNQSVQNRTLHLLKNGFRVILCVGETQKERESGQTKTVLENQMNECISESMIPYLNGTLVIAYEPVWAIGTGLTASPRQAEEAHQLLRKNLWDRFGIEASGRTSILYGGSVKPENFEELLECPNIDGGLVGGASLSAHSFLSLLETAARVAEKD